MKASNIDSQSTKKSEFQNYYGTITIYGRNPLYHMVVIASAIGFVGGCTVKWLKPAAAIIPLGCAVSTLYAIPFTLACGFLAFKVVETIKSNKIKMFVAIATFFISPPVFIIAGSFVFSLSSALSLSILLTTLAVAIVVDARFAKKVQKV